MKKRAFLLALATGWLFMSTSAYAVGGFGASLALASESIIVSDSVSVGLPQATEAAPTPEPVSPVVAVQQLYLSPSARSVTAGGSMTARLVLDIQNPSGTELEPFGVRFDLSDIAQVESEVEPGSADVTFNGNTLWVQNAVASGGHAQVNEREVTLSLTLTPFAQDSTAERAVISYELLNAQGNPVALEYSEQSGNIIRRKLTVVRADSGITEEEAELEDVEPTLEPTVEPTATVPIETPVPKQAILRANRAPEELDVGDTLILTAELVGYDGLETHIQWQQRIDGMWGNIEGQTGPTLEVLITEENHYDSWRYEVTVITTEQNEE